jgi:hypothetical protein
VSRVRERIDDAPPSMEQEVSDFLQLMEERDLVVLTEPEDQST